jgi:predicted ATP-binding protein involved in virulence
MKKVVYLIAIVLATGSLTSCYDFNRQQNQLDAESRGKEILLEAESSKKAKIEEAKANYESAKLEAQTKVTRAEANAQEKLISAKANAEAKLLNATAEAKANEILQKSITPDILEYFKIERWNGKLPTVTGNSSSLINLK